MNTQFSLFSLIRRQNFTSSARNSLPGSAEAANLAVAARVAAASAGVVRVGILAVAVLRDRDAADVAGSGK